MNICFVGILRLFTKTSVWQKGEVWRRWRGAKNLASTGSMRWSEGSNQLRSNLNTSHSPSGPSPMKQLCGRRCQSTHGLPWWQNSEEPSVFFSDFSSQPVWLFGMASRSCYPFAGPNIMDHGNTTLSHSMQLHNVLDSHNIHRFIQIKILLLWLDGTIESSPVRTFNINDCFGKNWCSYPTSHCGL